MNANEHEPKTFNHRGHEGHRGDAALRSGCLVLQKTTVIPGFFCAAASFLPLELLSDLKKARKKIRGHIRYSARTRVIIEEKTVRIVQRMKNPAARLLCPASG